MTKERIIKLYAEKSVEELSNAVRRIDMEIEDEKNELYGYLIPTIGMIADYLGMYGDPVHNAAYKDTYNEMKAHATILERSITYKSLMLNVVNAIITFKSAN